MRAARRIKGMLTAVTGAVALLLVPAIAAGPGTSQAAAEGVHREQRQTGSRDGVPIYEVPAGAVPHEVTEAMTPYTAFYTYVRPDRIRRTFRMHVPDGAAERRPLVTMLHGLSQTFAGVTSYSKWDAQSVRGRFATIYPGGHYASWNAERCCGKAVEMNVNDQASLTQMTRLARYALNSDPYRLYLAGFSNGGMMALTMACRSPQLWAGILVVSGSHVSPCRPRVAVPVMQVHGSRDTTVPYNGTSYSTSLKSPIPSVAKTQEIWRAVNGPAGKRLLLVRIAEGGHNWPQASGTPGTPYDTTTHAWNFLSGQRRSTPAPL